mmetsp:Transcript_14323/g.34580  ORF Transcript_14323/g.34580 Transcript_14323/m.34580 type:complete len:202 (+) Transcript_14323:1538-2143(+)
MCSGTLPCSLAYSLNLASLSFHVEGRSSSSNSNTFRVHPPTLLEDALSREFSASNSPFFSRNSSTRSRSSSSAALFFPRMRLRSSAVASRWLYATASVADGSFGKSGSRNAWTRSASRSSPASGSNDARAGWSAGSNGIPRGKGGSCNNGDISIVVSVVGSTWGSPRRLRILFRAAGVEDFAGAGASSCEAFDVFVEAAGW